MASVRMGTPFQEHRDERGTDGRDSRPRLMSALYGRVQRQKFRIVLVAIWWFLPVLLMIGFLFFQDASTRPEFQQSDLIISMEMSKP